MTDNPSDLLKETVVALWECRKLPGKPSYSTVYRWCKKGYKVRGTSTVIKLESCANGRTMVTSLQAHARFCDAVTKARDNA